MRFIAFLWMTLQCLQAFSQQKAVENAQASTIKAPQSLWEKGDLRPAAPLETSALLMLELYKKTASGNLGSSCRFSPECSRFMAESIRNQGFWTGLLLGCDRLLRCNHEAEIEHSDHLRDSKTGKIYDPSVEY
jgi:putative component of membrane protein insertase Oxa1/YidC/SpoIIIJ protein YidD